jgi:hypothetical protein
MFTQQLYISAGVEHIALSDFKFQEIMMKAVDYYCNYNSFEQLQTVLVIRIWGCCCLTNTCAIFSKYVGKVF